MFYKNNRGNLVYTNISSGKIITYEKNQVNYVRVLYLAHLVMNSKGFYNMTPNILTILDKTDITSFKPKTNSIVSPYKDPI